MSHPRCASALPPLLPPSLFLRYSSPPPPSAHTPSTLLDTPPPPPAASRERRKGELVFFIGAVRHCLLRSVGHERRVIEEMALLGPSWPAIDFFSFPLSFSPASYASIDRCSISTGGGGAGGKFRAKNSARGELDKLEIEF